MKKIALLVALAMMVATPALAAKKKSKRAPAAPVAQTMDTNEASYRLVRDSLPIWLPSWSIPIYMKVKEGEAQQTAPKVRKVKRAKARTT